MGRRGRVLSSPTIAALSVLAWATLSLVAAQVDHALASGRLLRRASDATTLSDELPYGGDVYHTNYRRSPGVVLTAVAALIAGVYLCLLGKRGWRFTTGLCTALMGQLLTWIVVINVAAIDLKGIVIWGFSMIGFVVGFAVGVLLWRFGIVVAGADGGLALALGLNLMVPHQSNSPTSVAPLYVWHGKSDSTDPEIACSLTGSFIFALGIDLFVEQASGFSLGLKYIFDQRHLPSDVSYQPSELTRVFLGVMWGLAIIATLFQTWRWRKYPFDGTDNEFTILLRDRTEDAAGSSRTRSVRSEDRLRESRGHMFSTSTYNGKRTSWELRDQKESKLDHLASPGPSHMSRTSIFEGRPIPTPPAVHHDQPPSPPSSIVSTEFARGLHSRPPTEYDHSRPVDEPGSVVLLRPIPRYAEPNPGPTPYYEETLTHATLLPVELVAAPPRRQRASVDRVVSVPANPNPTRANLAKRTSYRKPVPPLIDRQLLETATLNISTDRRSSFQPIENGNESAGHEKHSFEVPIAQGFASGRRYLLDQRGDNATLDGSCSETPIFGTNRNVREVGSSPETYGAEFPIESPSQAEVLPQVRPLLVSRFTSTTDHLPIANGAPSLGEPGVQFAAIADSRDLAPSVLFSPEAMPASSRGKSPGPGSIRRA